MADGDVILRGTTGADVALSAVSLYVNVAGTWKRSAAVYVNVAGTWKALASLDVNVGGTWKGAV